MDNRERLILSHLPQVEYLAKRLHIRCPQVELDDLIQAGTVGLIQAVDRFDPSRGVLLKTLAEHRIRDPFSTACALSILFREMSGLSKSAVLHCCSGNQRSLVRRSPSDWASR